MGFETNVVCRVMWRWASKTNVVCRDLAVDLKTNVAWGASGGGPRN